MSLSKIKVNNTEILGIVSDLSVSSNNSVPTSELLNRSIGLPLVVSYQGGCYITLDFDNKMIYTASHRIFVRDTNNGFLDIDLVESELQMDTQYPYYESQAQLWFLYLDKDDKNFRMVNYGLRHNFSNAERYLLVGFGIPVQSKLHNFLTSCPVKIGDVVIYPQIYSTELRDEKYDKILRDLPDGTINLLDVDSPNVYPGYSTDGINWTEDSYYHTSDYISVEEEDKIKFNSTYWTYTYDVNKEPIKVDTSYIPGYSPAADGYALVRLDSHYLTIPEEVKYIRQIFAEPYKYAAILVKYPYDIDEYIPYSSEYQIKKEYLPSYLLVLPEEVEKNYLEIKPFCAYDLIDGACVEVNTNTFQITVKVSDFWYMDDNGDYIRFTNIEEKTNNVIANTSYSKHLLYYIFFDKSELTFILVHYSAFSSSTYNKSRYVCFGNGLLSSPNYFSTMSSIIIDSVLYPSIVPQQQISFDSSIQNDFNTSEIGNLDFPYPEDADYCLILLYGQSLSMGWECPEAITTTALPDCYMVGSSPMTNHGNDNSTVLNPLVAVQSTIGGEQPIVGITNAFANLYKRWRPAKNQKFIGTSAGEGGRSIEQLSKPCTNGTNYYTTEFLKAITNTKTAVGQSTVVCPAIVYMQGEHNYTGSGLGMTPGTEATKDKNTYKSLLRLLKQDMQADIMSKYNLTKKPMFFCYMVAGAYINLKDMPINMAMIELSQEDDDVFILNSTYGVPDYNGGHLSTNGYRWYGELVAHTLYNVFVRGLKHEPVMPKSFNVELNKIYIDCYCPVKPLVIDTWTKETITNYGFRVYKNDSDVSISSVSVISNRIILTVSDDISSGKLEVTYAGMGRGGSGNVRDSDEFHSLYTYYDDRESSPSKRENYTPKDESGNYIYGKPYPMYNWLASFYKLIRQS